MLISFCLLLFFAHQTKAQFSPSGYSFSFVEAVYSNGSILTGFCNSPTYAGTTTIKCSSPNIDTSVLSDGVIPTLSGLDGDMWAHQLLTLQPRSVLAFNFTGKPDYLGVGRVEVAMFNCPQWGISVQDITAWGYDGTPQIIISTTVNVNTVSCESLVTVCIPLSTTLPVIILMFTPSPSSSWVHLAEVEFYGTDNNTCPPPMDATTPPPMDATTPPPIDPTFPTTPPPMDPTTPPSTPFPGTTEGFAATACSESPVSSQQCSTSNMPVIMASVITAIVTALLSIVIFALVQIAVCKCHPKLKPGGYRAETGISAGGEPGQEYEQMNGCAASVAPVPMCQPNFGGGVAGGSARGREEQVYEQIEGECLPKFTPGGAEKAEGEGQEYEQMDGGGGEGGVAVSEPTYMEVIAGEGEDNDFHFKENISYASHSQAK